MPEVSNVRQEPTHSINAAQHRSRAIRRELSQLSDDFIRRHAVLQHQDALGATILVGSAAAILISVFAYAHGVFPAWSTVISCAFFSSLLHETEHDLIHRLYFKNNRILYNLAMLTVWVFRPNTVNPWIRREWHLHHHRASGTASDFEERGLTNGERWGVRRAIMALEPGLAVLLRPQTIHRMMTAYADAQAKNMSERRRIILRNLSCYTPFGLLYACALYTWGTVHILSAGASMLGYAWQPAHWLQPWLPTLDFLAVTVLMPNSLRTFCLYFVSSNIHYHGDIDPKNIVQQTQVWNAPWLLPLQLFCFNFGSTHAIHHFAVQYPFYVRQLVAGDAHRVMRRYGVRFNDFHSMARANRWHRAALTTPQ